MSVATWYTGDALEVLRTLPDGSVDLVITSPPFLALRSYLPADDPNKHLEMGSEATPGLFVDGLMRVVEECRRVLAPHGSLGLELGDTYAGSGGPNGGDNKGNERYPDGRGVGSNHRPTSAGFPLAKSLSLIPETVRFTMVYGFNPHTQRGTEQWRLRNVVRWCRPNPPVGALGDKYRPATTELMIFAKNAKRYFDLDAVRTEHVNPRPPDTNGQKNATKLDGQGHGFDKRTVNAAGAPPLDYWEIPTQPYKGAHYATWPRRLLEIPLKSMVPRRVCRVCGSPSERITEKTPEYEAFRTSKTGVELTEARAAYHLPAKGGAGSLDHREDSGARGQLYDTIGWFDCGHDDWRNGVVLDPFAGTGTTLESATGLGLDAIGIDLDERNHQLAVQRVGMFLTDGDPLDTLDPMEA